MQRTTIYMDPATPERLAFLRDLDGEIAARRQSPLSIGYDVYPDSGGPMFHARRVRVSKDSTHLIYSGEIIHRETGEICGLYRCDEPVEAIRKIVVTQPNYHVRRGYILFALAFPTEPAGFRVFLTSKPMAKREYDDQRPALVSTWNFPDMASIAHWIGFELYADWVTLTIKPENGPITRRHFHVPPNEYQPPNYAYTKLD